MGNLSKRKAIILGMENNEDWFQLFAEIPLNEMFGYSGELRSTTQGKGEFTMEYSKYTPCPMDVQDRVVRAYQEAAGLLPVEKKKKN